MDTVALSGESQAKGRNGYFRVARMASAFFWTRPETPITVELSSRRDGDSAPLVLDLTRDDTRALVGAITAALVDLSLYNEYPEYAARLRNYGTTGAGPKPIAALRP